LQKILVFTLRCLRAFCTRSWMWRKDYFTSSTFLRNCFIFFWSFKMLLNLASDLVKLMIFLICWSWNSFSWIDFRERSSNVKDNCCVESWLFVSSFWSSISFHFILAIKETNCIFIHTINFFVVLSIHARWTMQSYLLMFRRKQWHIEQFFNLTIENDFKLDFNLTIKSALSDLSKRV